MSNLIQGCERTAFCFLIIVAGIPQGYVTNNANFMLYVFS